MTSTDLKLGLNWNLALAQGPDQMILLVFRQAIELSQEFQKVLALGSVLGEASLGSTSKWWNWNWDGKKTSRYKQTMLDEAHWQSLWTNESTRLSSLPEVSYTFLRTAEFPDARAAAARFLLLYALFFFSFSSSSCAFTWRLQAVDWTNECRFCQPRLNTGSWWSLPWEEASSDSDSSLWKGRFAFLFFWPTCVFSFSSPSHPKGLGAVGFTNFLTGHPFSGPSFWNGGMWPSLSHHQINNESGTESSSLK